jgi:hypothetical protein
MQACSQVAAMDMLLWGALAMVGRDILHPIRVSFEKGNSLLEFLRVLLYSLASTSIAPSPGTAHMPGPWGEVIRVQEAAATTEAAHDAMVPAAEASAQEATAAQECAMALVKVPED